MMRARKLVEQRRVAALGVHRRLELALVGEQRVELALDRRRHVLGVVRQVGLEQHQRPRAERGEVEVTVEVRVAGADDGVAHQLAGDAVIGMEAVALPRVMAEHDVGVQAANRPDDLGSRGDVVRQLAVDPAEKDDLARLGAGQSPGRLPLLLLSPVDERRADRRPGPRCPSSRRCTRGDGRRTLAAAHLARVPPAPNSMSSGWAPTARAHPGASRSIVAVGAERRLLGTAQTRAQRRLARIVCNHAGSSFRRAG